MTNNTAKMAILDHYDDMTSVEKTIADFFVKNREMMDFSSKNIAAMMYVSEASLSRFAKKCGFQGFREFVFLYQGELSEEIQETGVSALAREVHDSYDRILDACFKNIDEDQIRRISDEMEKRKVVLVLGKGSSGVAAQEFELRFMRLGLDIRAITDSQVMTMKVAMCDEDNMVIAVSLRGETKEIIDAVQGAKERGAYTVVFTGNRKSRLFEMADEAVELQTLKNLDGGNAISPQFPVLLMIDVLYSYYLANNSSQKKSKYLTTLEALKKREESSGPVRKTKK